MGLPFKRQRPIGKFIVDFYCQPLMLAIEVDGLSHQFEEVYVKDELKEDWLIKQGIQVIRYQDSEVMLDWDNVLRSLENELMLRADYLGIALPYQRKVRPSY